MRVRYFLAGLMVVCGVLAARAQTNSVVVTNVIVVGGKPALNLYAEELALASKVQSPVLNQQAKRLGKLWAIVDQQGIRRDSPLYGAVFLAEKKRKAGDLVGYALWLDAAEQKFRAAGFLTE